MVRFILSTAPFVRHDGHGALIPLIFGLAPWCDHPGCGAPGARECGRPILEPWTTSPRHYLAAPAACQDALRARIRSCRVRSAGIQGHLWELYGTEVSPDLISRVTDAVLEEVQDWQSRLLDACYPVVFFDALRVKIRDEGLVRNKAVYVALALDADGQKHVLGHWIEQTEGAQVLAEGHERPEDPGRRGHPDRRGRRAEGLKDGWGARYPTIGQSWRRARDHVMPLFAFPRDIRKMIYTTNVVESLHRSLRKIIKTRGSFPNDEAAVKLLYLAIQNAGVHWRRPIEWTAAMGQFAVLFGDRFALSAR